VQRETMIKVMLQTSRSITTYK